MSCKSYRQRPHKLYRKQHRLEIVTTLSLSIGSRNMFKKKIRIWKMYKSDKKLTAPRSSDRRVQRRGPTSGRRGQTQVAHRLSDVVTKNITVQRNLPDPVDFIIPQEMYSAIQAFVSSRLQPRLRYIFAEQGTKGMRVQRLDLPTPQTFLTFDAAFLNGIQAVSAGKSATCGAFFEKGFRLMHEVLLSDHFSMIIKIMKIVFESQLHGLPDVGKMVTQQFMATAQTILGPDHPHVKWSRGLRLLYDSPGIFQRVMEAISAVMQDVLGVEDNYSLTMRDAVLKYSYTSPEMNPSPQDTIAKFETLLEDCHKSMFKSNYPFMSVQNSFSHFLMSHGYSERAETILSGTPVQLIENREMPIRRNTLLDSVCLLAESMAHQGKDALAERTFSFAISNSIEIFGTEDDETLGAYQRYADFLASRGRESEVRSLTAMIDSKLESYMLRPESIGHMAGSVA